MRKGVFQARMDTNWAGQLHKMASGLIIPDLGRRGIFYHCSENKGVYELRGYHETDLCVFFCTCSKLFFNGLAHMSCHYKICFRTRSDTNQTVHLHSL